MNNQTGNEKNSAGRIITLVILFSIGYAIVRYHIAGPVPWKDFPFFILNKGISLAAFVLITCNFGFGPLNNLGVKVPTGWLNQKHTIFGEVVASEDQDMVNKIAQNDIIETIEITGDVDAFLEANKELLAELNKELAKDFPNLK